MTDRVRQLGESEQARPGREEPAGEEAGRPAIGQVTGGGGSVSGERRPAGGSGAGAVGPGGVSAGGPRRSGRGVRWYGTAQWGLLVAGLTATAGLAALIPESGVTPYLLVFVPGIACLLVAFGVLTVIAEREAEALQARLEHAQQLADLNSSVIASFAMAVDAKDQHTHGHTERVRDLATLIGAEMGLAQEELDALRMAAMLHDIGKLAVPDYILSKPERLTPEEMKKVQTHTLVGAALLESVKFPWPVVPIIRSHHEWYDGRGYPDALAGEGVPLGARILAVADVYDALLSHRPYRPAMSVQEAVAFMRDRVGTQFDPGVVETCFRVLSEKQARNRFGFIFDAEGPMLPREGMSDTPDRRSVFTDIKHAHQELLALYEIVQTVSQSSNISETLELVLDKTKRIVEFSTCAVFLGQQNGGDLVAVTAMGMHAEVIRGRSLPLGKGLTGQVAKSGKPSGLGKEASADLAYLLGPAAAESPLKHALAVPLTTDGGCVGAITLYRTSEQGFTEDDARLASVVARQTGIAIKNAGQFEQTKQSALTDQLTGLSNARYFFMHLEQELNRAQREQRPMSLIAIDLNRLKRINDSFGHQQGDRALKTIAEVFRRHVRNYDTVVRYAGDEFFIILPDTTNQLAVETANRIKQAVRDTSLEVLPHQFISLSASFGVATFPGDAKEAEALIAVADRAMYADKRLNQQAALLSAEGRAAGTQEAALGEEPLAGQAELHVQKRDESLRVPEEGSAVGKPRSPRTRTPAS